MNKTFDDLNFIQAQILGMFRPQEDDIDGVTATENFSEEPGQA